MTAKDKPCVPGDWIHIYYISKDGEGIIYDRTVSRTGLGPARAKQVIEQWEVAGREAFYVIGATIRGAYS